MKAGGKGDDRRKWFDGITDSMDMSLSKLQEMVKNTDAICVVVQRLQKVGHN